MRAARGRGFTLLETLVAVTLLALLFGALMPVFQQGLEVLHRGDRHTRAVLLAESLLAQAAGEAAAESAGREEDLRWSLSRAAYDGAEDGAPAIEADAPLTLQQVSATVTWDGGGDGVTLTTLVLEAAR